MDAQDPQIRRQISNDVQKEIAEKVLTAEQREKFEQDRKQLQDRPRGDRGAGGERSK